VIGQTVNALVLILNARQQHADSPALQARYLRTHLELAGNMDLCEEIMLELRRRHGREPELWSPSRASAEDLNRDAKALAPKDGAS
jgi:hypothetical protein